MSFVINKAVVDLRKEPTFLTLNKKDPLQESQLLYGENLTILHREREWLYIEALEQKKFTKDAGWTGYKGWILNFQVIETKNIIRQSVTVLQSWADIYAEPSFEAPLLLSVSMGTRLQAVDQLGGWLLIDLADGTRGAIPKVAVKARGKPVKNQIADRGVECLNHPYLWGGRSVYNPGWKDQITSCDCSGFVNLLYRVEGLDIPRDAHDQFLFCQRKEFEQLEVADLIFLAKSDHPERIGHVMLYAGQDHFLDANITDGKIVKASAENRFGKPFKHMRWGENLGTYTIFFGSVNCFN